MDRGGFINRADALAIPSAVQSNALLSSRVRRIVTALSLIAIGALDARAQCVDPRATWTSVTSIQSFPDQRRRMSQDLGQCSTAGELIRSVQSITPPLTLPPTGPVRWAFAMPTVDATYNSALPFSLNDGPQWAGRGLTTTLSGQVVFQGGPVSLDSALGLAVVPGEAREGRGGEPLGWRRVHGAIGLVDLDAPPELLAAELGSLRIFAGYAGWGPGQLEDELLEGAWYVVESEPGDVSAPDPERLWRSVLRRQRSELAMVATYPDDPSLN